MGWLRWLSAVAFSTAEDALRTGGPARRLAFDNALMETVNGLYKTECIKTDVFHQRPFRTIADVEYATAGWVDWYNARRLHSTLGMVPPIEYEAAHYAALAQQSQPV